MELLEGTGWAPWVTLAVVACLAPVWATAAYRMLRELFAVLILGTVLCFVVSITMPELWEALCGSFLESDLRYVVVALLG